MKGVGKWIFLIDKHTDRLEIAEDKHFDDALQYLLILDRPEVEPSCHLATNVNVLFVLFVSFVLDPASPNKYSLADIPEKSCYC